MSAMIAWFCGVVFFGFIGLLLGMIFCRGINKAVGANQKPEDEGDLRALTNVFGIVGAAGAIWAVSALHWI